MNNILAIAQKELRSYFASPIAYVVVGLFAVLFGYFYLVSLNFVVRLGMQAGMFGAQGGPQTINLNEFMLRPLLGNTAVVLLFVLPMITMRTYAEEKKSGTIELLLTSALTDLQNHHGQVSGSGDAVRADVSRHVSPYGNSVLVRRTRARSDFKWLPWAPAHGRLFHLDRAVHLEHY